MQDMHDLLHCGQMNAWEVETCIVSSLFSVCDGFNMKLSNRDLKPMNHQNRKRPYFVFDPSGNRTTELALTVLHVHVFIHL